MGSGNVVNAILYAGNTVMLKIYAEAKSPKQLSEKHERNNGLAYPHTKKKKSNNIMPLFSINICSVS